MEVLMRCLVLVHTSEHRSAAPQYAAVAVQLYSIKVLYVQYVHMLAFSLSLTGECVGALQVHTSAGCAIRVHLGGHLSMFTSCRSTLPQYAAVRLRAHGGLLPLPDHVEVRVRHGLLASGPLLVVVAQQLVLRSTRRSAWE